jgi:CheY-like chemotaxis protein
MADRPAPRVAIVDDDIWVRAGRAAMLDGAGFEVVRVCDHEAALDDHQGWGDVDIALVDAWDAEQDWDRFPGVRVVEAIRRSEHGGRILVLVISVHATNEVLRLRMAEAGADFFYAHSELRGPDDLVRAMTRPDDARRSRSGDGAVLEALGIQPTSRLNAALHDIEDRGLESAFQPATSQKALPVGRRTLITARRRLAEIARLSRPTSDGSDQPPQWRRVARAVNVARGAEAPPET